MAIHPNQEEIIENFQSFAAKFFKLERNTVLEICSRFQVHILTKKTLIINFGQIYDRIYFVHNGLVRGYYKEDEKDITNWFAKKNDFVFSPKGYLTKQPSDECIETLEDCVLLSITLENLSYLYANFPEASNISRILTEHYLRNSTSWNTLYSKYNTERQIITPTKDSYNTANGVSFMVNDIQSKIGFQNESNTIAISHSMGGVAIRHINAYYPNRFSGVVLFWAPLKGTQGANNLINGNGANYVSNATYKLSRGPLSGVFSYLFLNLLGQNLEISKHLGERTMNGIKSYLGIGSSNATTNDLSWNSSYNQQFYNSSTSTTKFILWGNENSPAHLRFAAGLLEPNNSAAETQMVSAYETAKGYYAAKRDYFSSVKWYDPRTYLFSDWRQTQWDIGYKYLANEMESEWAYLVGAGSTQPYTYTSYVYKYNNGYVGYNNCVNVANGDSFTLSQCFAAYFNPVTMTAYSWVKEPYDGLVNKSSATGAGTSWTGNADIREHPGNDHQEMRWSPESQSQLDAAFNGLRSTPSAFTIAKR